MAFKPKFTITPKINKTLVEIERVRGFLDVVRLKEEWIADTWDAQNTIRAFLKSQEVFICSGQLQINKNCIKIKG